MSYNKHKNKSISATNVNTDTLIRLNFLLAVRSQKLSNCSYGLVRLYPGPNSGPDGIRTHVQNISIKLSTCLYSFTIFISTILCTDVAFTWWMSPPYESLQHHYNCQICPRHCPLVNNAFYF